MLVAMAGGLGPIEDARDEVGHLAADAGIAGLVAESLKRRVPDRQRRARVREAAFPDYIDHPPRPIVVGKDGRVRLEVDALRLADDDSMGGAGQRTVELREPGEIDRRCGSHPLADEAGI